MTTTIRIEKKLYLLRVEIARNQMVIMEQCEKLQKIGNYEINEIIKIILDSSEYMHKFVKL